MGFFDKLKSMANAITGGGAKVSIEAPQPCFAKPFEVTVRATVSSVNLNIQSVYVTVESEEIVKISRERVLSQLGSDLGERAGSIDRRGDIEEEETLCEFRVQIAGAQQLQANQSYEWKGQVQIPADALPTFVGRNAKHVWRIKAGLDAVGNDPSSDWLEIVVK
jgi:hypothetical protein